MLNFTHMISALALILQGHTLYTEPSCLNSMAPSFLVLYLFEGSRSQLNFCCIYVCFMKDVQRTFSQKGFDLKSVLNKKGGAKKRNHSLYYLKVECERNKNCWTWVIELVCMCVCVLMLVSACLCVCTSQPTRSNLSLWCHKMWFCWGELALLAYVSIMPVRAK